MKIADLRAKTQDELKDQLVQLKKEQFNLRFQRAGGQLESTGRIRLVRREVARIKTILGGKATAPAHAKTASAAKPAAKAKKK
jgi:large subunit ribosomal protein L29